MATAVTHRQMASIADWQQSVSGERYDSFPNDEFAIVDASLFALTTDNKKIGAQ